MRPTKRHNSKSWFWLPQRKRRCCRWLASRWWSWPHVTELWPGYAQLTFGDKAALTQSFCRRGQRFGIYNRDCRREPRHRQCIRQPGSVLGPPRRGWRYLGRRHLGLLQNPSLHPSLRALLSVISTNPDSTRKLLAEIIRLTPLLVEQGHGGYGNVSTGWFQLLVLSPNITMEQTNTTFLPLFEFAHSQPGLSAENATIQFPDFPTVYETLFDTGDGEIGSPIEISSWLLPKDVVPNR